MEKKKKGKRKNEIPVDSLDLDQDLLSPSVQSPEESAESADSQVRPKALAGSEWEKIWVLGCSSQRALSAAWLVDPGPRDLPATLLKGSWWPWVGCTLLPWVLHVPQPGVSLSSMAPGSCSLPPQHREAGQPCRAGELHVSPQGSSASGLGG